MSEKSAAPQIPTLLPFPFVLPDGFLCQIGYPGGGELVGLFGQGDLAALAIYDSTQVWTRGLDCRPWLDLVQDPLVSHWLTEFYVNLGGDLRLLPTHHLIVVRDANSGFLAPATSAMRLVQRQRRRR